MSLICETRSTATDLDDGGDCGACLVCVSADTTVVTELRERPWGGGTPEFHQRGGDPYPTNLADQVRASLTRGYVNELSHRSS